MKTLLGKLVAAVAAVAFVSASALAVTPTPYSAGYRQEGNLNGLNGLVVAGPTAPTTVGSTCSAGTLTVVGGATAGQVTTATCTTLVLILTGSVSSLVVSSGLNDGKNATNSSTPPNGAICIAYDETHPNANAAIYGTYAATATTYTCTFASQTITAADVMKYLIVGY